VVPIRGLQPPWVNYGTKVPEPERGAFLPSDESDGNRKNLVATLSVCVDYSPKEY